MKGKSSNQELVISMSSFIPTPPILTYIFDIAKGQVVKEGDDQYRWVLISSNGEKIYKIRLSGTIVSKYYGPKTDEKKSFASLTIDDGTETIRVKAWEETADALNQFSEGEEIEIIGRPRLSEDEIYVLPDDFLKIEDYNKELYLRTKKIKRYVKKNLVIPSEKKSEEMDYLAEKEKVWEIIASSENSVSMDFIISESKLDKSTVEKIVHDLMNNSDIYQPTEMMFKKV
jgi:RPA family protein